jgi:hypothetical protein
MRNQFFHIFRKDIHQRWREIVLSFALIVAYGWHEATRSLTSADMPDAFSFLWQMLPLLLVVSWALLILRSAQAECLVGDRQFWVTRPYEWKQLLAAKFLFMAVFINVPLFILQVFLLLMAGFPPTSHLAGLFGLQLLWILILILPVVTLAAVTASIGQFMLSILGVLLYAIALQSVVPPAGVSGLYAVPGWLSILVIAGAGLVVVLQQYARRRTAPSRILLLSAGALVPIIIFATPYRILIERAYPLATARPLPVQLAFDPAKPASNEGGYPEKNKVHIRIPLLVSGVPEGNRVTAAGVTVSIQAPGGQQWSSGWHNAHGFFPPNRPHSQTFITLDRDFFDRVKSSPAKVQITYALEPAHARDSVRIVAQAGEFSVPGEGRCTFSPFQPGMIQCVFPLKAPHMSVGVKSDEITCAPRQNETPLPPSLIGHGWVWSSSVFGVEFRISPVILRPLWVNEWGEVKTRYFYPGVCPGTPLTMFTNWEDLPRTRIELEIDSIRLADYQLKDTRGEGVGGFDVSVP